MDRKQLIDHYLQRLNDKGFEIYDVRRELEEKNVEEEEIKIIVRAVDDELQARLLKSATADYTGVFIRMGIILILIGVVLGLIMVFGVVEPGDFFIFVYAAFFGGLSVLVIGLFKRKKVNIDNTPEPDKGQPGRSRVSFRKKS
jgi:hypothetical protein